MNHIKILSYTTAIAILIWSGSVAYYFMVALPEQNNRKILIAEEELQMKKDAENKKIEEENRLQEEEAILRIEEEWCIEKAWENYQKKWETACKLWKNEVDDSWNECISNKFSWESDLEHKNRCKRTTPDYQTDWNGTCLLPSGFSDNITETLESDKSECRLKYSN